MRIAHLCLSNWYIPHLNYQENELIRQHVKDGHDVLVLASTEVQNPKGGAAYEKPGSFVGPEGAKVVRLPYRLWPHKLARKIRAHPDVMKHLETFKPDSILYHGTCGWEVMTAARYARRNPSVLFYIDSHEDANNSARSFVSREFLHKLFYKFCLQRAWPAARKVLCISMETINFVRDTYKVPSSHLEFYPLGGKPVAKADYAAKRKKTRTLLGLSDGDMMFLQSGRQTRRKKLLEALKAFQTHGPAQARLFIVGSLTDDIRAEAEALLQHTPKATFLGWKSPDELTDLLCAADVYLQPGTQSVTMQHSLCCHCAVIIDDVPSHQVYHDGNGWLLNADMTLEQAFAAVGKADTTAMGERSFAIALKLLDYAALSQRILRTA